MWLRIKTVLVFALLGPVVGGLIGCPVFFCGVGIFGSATADFAGQLPSILALCTVYGPLFGYFIGFVPAMITGTVLAAWMPVPAKAQTARAVAVSVFVTLLYALSFFGIRVGLDVETWNGAAVLAGLMLLSATLSAVVCWRILSATTSAPVAPPPPAAPAPPPA